MLAHILVRDDLIHGRGRHDVAQASATEFTGIANGDCSAGDFHHDAVDLRLQDVRCKEARSGIEAIDAKKQNIRAQLP